MTVTNRATNSDGTDATSYTTGSFTPTANSLIIVCFSDQNGVAGTTVDSVTGGSLTWTAISSKNYRSGATTSNIFIYAALAPSSPSSMSVTFDYNGVTQTGQSWSVFDVTGTDVPNGVLQTFVQAVATAGINQSGTSIAITLASAGNANNRAFCVASHEANEATTEQTSWTEIGDTNHGTPNNGFATQWRSDIFDTAAGASWSTSSIKAGIAFEVKAIPSFIKTVNGLARASVKTVDGLALANIGTIEGLQ